MVVEVDHPSAGRLKLLGSPIKLRGTPVIQPTRPPILGQHTNEVLKSTLWLIDERIAQLRANKVVALCDAGGCALCTTIAIAERKVSSTI